MSDDKDLEKAQELDIGQGCACTFNNEYVCKSHQRIAAALKEARRELEAEIERLQSAIKSITAPQEAGSDWLKHVLAEARREQRAACVTRLYEFLVCAEETKCEACAAIRRVAQAIKEQGDD